MKLNAKGLDLLNKWDGIYSNELEKLRKELNDPDYFEGWSIIDDGDHCPTIEDCVGLAVYGDDDNAIYHILENYRPDEHYAYGYTAAQVVEMLKTYFDIEPDDDLSWSEE